MAISIENEVIDRFLRGCREVKPFDCMSDEDRKQLARVLRAGAGIVPVTSIGPNEHIAVFRDEEGQLCGVLATLVMKYVTRGVRDHEVSLESVSHHQQNGDIMVVGVEDTLHYLERHWPPGGEVTIFIFASDARTTPYPIEELLKSSGHMVTTHTTAQ